MNIYKVSIKKGNLKSTDIVLPSDKPENAEKEAKKISVLRKYPTWTFTANKIGSIKTNVKFKKEIEPNLNSKQEPKKFKKDE